MENSPLHVCRLQPARGELMPTLLDQHEYACCHAQSALTNFASHSGLRLHLRRVGPEQGSASKTQLLFARPGGQTCSSTVSPLVAFLIALLSVHLVRDLKMQVSA